MAKETNEKALEEMMKELTLPKKVDLCESLAREGPQHCEKFISTEAKVWVIHAAIDCGFKTMETTNFANPKRLPQFRDAHEVLRRIDKKKREGVEIMALAIVEQIVEVGELDPERVTIPGIFVQRVVKMPKLVLRIDGHEIPGYLRPKVKV